MFVEVDIDAKFPTEIEVDMGNGKAFVVGVEYPWLPLKCVKCSVFGHQTRDCGAAGASGHGIVTKNQWVPKKPPNVKDTENGNPIVIEQQIKKDDPPLISKRK